MLWNLQAQNRIHKRPTTVLSQINPLHAHPFLLVEYLYFNILLFTLGLPIGLFPSGFPDSYDEQHLFGDTKLTAWSR